MNDELSNQDRPLWERYLGERYLGERYLAVVREGSSGTTRMDANTLAAYLDGTADDAQVARVEQAAVSDPELLEQILALRDVQRSLREEAGQPCSSEWAGQQALARRAVNKARATRLAPSLWMRVGQFGTQWAAAALFVMAAGTAGYMAGHQTAQSDTAVNVAAVQFEEFELEQPLLVFAVGNGGAR